MIPAYEDTTHFMLVEQKLPVNVTPETNKLEDAAERQRIIAVFDRGLNTPVSYVLPIQAWQTADRGRRWVTERWALRRSELFLYAGRLAGRLPAAARLVAAACAPISYPHVLPRDPFADCAAAAGTSRVDAAPTAPSRSKRRRRQWRDRTKYPELCARLSPSSRATASSACSCRRWRMPKTTRHWLPRSKRRRGPTELSVLVEGYTPPQDPRINVIKVTPDPGVIEVNIHPAKSWDEAVDITTTLYEEAHATRLSTEKFMLDGRHTGTGGGNHIVLGGMTPADSPFLRRPDLLGSIITYWQNHPSLSYLFSGMFIGPTSQAPRVDEGRHDALYETGDRARIDPRSADRATSPPWLVDRIFRNLLIDVTGNTHRAEICIDKLFSPDGPTGRLGLVEFRSFEMPPHARMSLAQQLLIRALVAHVLGEALSADAGALGHRAARPLHAAALSVDGLRRDHFRLQGAGLPIELSWFEPHLEFRFPQCGDRQCGRR